MLHAFDKGFELPSQQYFNRMVFPQHFGKCCLTADEVCAFLPLQFVGSLLKIYILFGGFKYCTNIAQTLKNNKIQYNNNNRYN